MPDSICDSKMLKKSAEENEKIIRKADEKLKEAAERIRRGIILRRVDNFRPYSRTFWTKALVL